MTIGWAESGFVHAHAVPVNACTAAVRALSCSTIHEPGHRHGYTLLAEGRIRDYQGEVSFVEGSDGTRVTWHGR